jgi:hypothetical protein
MGMSAVGDRFVVEAKGIQLLAHADHYIHRDNRACPQFLVTGASGWRSHGAPADQRNTVGTKLRGRSLHRDLRSPAIEGRTLQYPVERHRSCTGDRQPQKQGEVLRLIEPEESLERVHLVPLR